MSHVKGGGFYPNFRAKQTPAQINNLASNGSHSIFPINNKNLIGASSKLVSFPALNDSLSGLEE